MFCNVTLAVPDWPGFMPVNVNSVVQPLLTLVSVVAPPVERQADPPCLVSLSTIVPVANLLVGFLVSAEKLATVAVTVYAHNESKVTTVMMILVLMSGPGRFVVAEAPAGVFDHLGRWCALRRPGCRTALRRRPVVLRHRVSPALPFRVAMDRCERR